ncbi:hypothetical protein [Microvirga sp. G4-2]|uniref:hypothetical protein n=1 Tax=Microvirga sp. G4-2 TaxID=3434467 RepID=UPI004044E346
MRSQSDKSLPLPQERIDHDRREFLAKCGKFAAITPPAMTLLLSTSLTSNAIAKSASGNRKHPNNGYGNSGGDGIPGKSGKTGKTDSNR